MTTTVGIFGTGLMGSAFARQLLKLGYRVVVWNRTASRAEPLVVEGAVLAATPADLLAQSDVTIALTSTTPEVEAMLAVAPSLAGKDFINLVTTTPKQARKIGEAAAGAGAAFLSGTIQCYPSNIGSEEAVIMYGGDAALWERRADMLRGLAGGSYLVGEDAGLPNVVDSSVTASFLFTAISAAVEAGAYAVKDGMPMADFRALLQTYLAVLPNEIDKVFDAIERDDFGTTDATLATYAKSLEQFRQAFRDAGATDLLLAANHARMEKAIAASDAQAGFAALYRI